MLRLIGDTKVTFRIAKAITFFLVSTVAHGGIYAQEGKSFTLEEKDGVRYVHNIALAWGENPKVGIKHVQEIGDMFGTDEHYNLSSPADAAIDAVGNIYILDAGNHRIQKYGRDGKYIATIGKRGKGPGELITPSQIAINSQNEIFVTNPVNKSIQVFSTEGEFLRSIDEDILGYAFILMSGGKMAYVDNGTLPDDLKSHRMVNILDKSGKTLKQFGKPRVYDTGRTSANGNIVYMASDRENNVYLAFQYLNRIDKYNADGELVLQIDRKAVYEESPAFGKGENAEQGQRRRRGAAFGTGIGVDNQGRIWVGSMKRPPTRQESSRKATSKVYKFEVYDQEGVLLANLDVPTFKPNGTFRLYGDRIFVIDNTNIMSVNEYMIVDK